MVGTAHGALGSLIFEVIDKLSNSSRRWGEVLYWFVTLPLCFASHFLLDMIPHYDYSLTMSQGLIRLVVDLAICSAILIGFTSKQSLDLNNRDKKMLFAGFVAIFPDVIVKSVQFLNLSYFSWFVAFHDRMHAHTRIGPFWGMTIQAVFVFLCCMVLTKITKKTAFSFSRLND